MGRVGDDPADAMAAGGFGEQTQVGRDAAVSRREPEVGGARFEVTPVRVEVDAVLLDDEHLGAQAQGGVQVGGADLGPTNRCAG